MKKNGLIKILTVLLVLFAFASLNKRLYCSELEKEVELKKDYSFCTFTISGEGLEGCNGYLISPNGGTYALSFIDGYFVATIEKVEGGIWTVKIVSESEEEVPPYKVSVSSNTLVKQGTDVADTSIAKKITALQAYMEDDCVNISWEEEENESVVIDILNANTLENLTTISEASGKARYQIPEDVERVIVKCVYYRYKGYDNAYTSFVFDKSELPKAEIAFNCDEKTNLNTVECKVSTDAKYTVYNNGNEMKGDISFDEGLNHVVIRLVSESGYIRNYEYDFIKDTKPPVISLDTDINLMNTTYEQYKISGNVTDAVSLMVQGNYVQFNDEGYFETILNFNLGENEIVIKALDDTGNITEYIAYVTRYEEQSKINPLVIIIGGLVLIIACIIFFGKKLFKRNLRAELQKKEEENDAIKHELEEERYKATHDELTKCKNRTGYMQDLKNTNISDVCIINFDVNNLKWTNDNLGHQSGDRLLFTISDLLKEKFENVYRMGGDEFTVLTDKYTFDENLLYEIDEILAEKTREDVDNIIYQVAYGYDFGDGIKTEKEISHNADLLMYEDKKMKKERLKADKDNLVEKGFSVESIDSLLRKHDRKVALESGKKQDHVKTSAIIKEESKKVDSKQSVILYIIKNIPYVLLLVCVYLLTKVFYIGTVESDSMYPTMKTGDVVVGSRIYYDYNEIKRGDRIVFIKDGYNIGKRVIGIGEDVISFKNGYVVINGEVTKEDYLNEDLETLGVGEYEVPENGLFVLGDNRSNSYDSRYWDNPYVSKDEVIAKIFMSIPQKYAVVLKYMFLGIAVGALILIIISEMPKKDKEEEY